MRRRLTGAMPGRRGRNRGCGAGNAPSTVADRRRLGKVTLSHSGAPDDLKFRSSMTLFGRADPDAAEFTVALARYFDGREDFHTLKKLDIS